jgi:6-phosphogluconate dehydrogenase
MKLGMVGLGRMGSGMTERLRGDGHEVMTYDPQVESTAASLEELAQQLEPPRVVWMMIPAGKITEKTTRELIGILDRGDVLVDGGNSNFHDSQRRNAEAAEQGIHFLDVGVSGGIWGLKEGFCRWPGGPTAVARVQPALGARARGRLELTSDRRTGHFVKMVRNSIRRVMQAYAEASVLNASSSGSTSRRSHVNVRLTLCQCLKDRAF